MDNETDREKLQNKLLSDTINVIYPYTGELTFAEIIGALEIVKQALYYHKQAQS